MNLKILEPFQIFAEKTGVRRIVAETCDGSYGFLPHRRDCVSALVPGILVYETVEEGESYVAIDEGVMVKTGSDVLISVRRAIKGTDLRELRNLVEQEFLTIDAQEHSARLAMEKLETGFLRRLATYRHE